jgi:hypothetical protein
VTTTTFNLEGLSDEAKQTFIQSLLSEIKEEEREVVIGKQRSAVVAVLGMIVGVVLYFSL